MMKRFPRRSPRFSAGFSLVELMVALVIGLIMMAGLIQIFIANRQSYRVMEGANFMQENMRFAIDRIAMSVRLADHWGGTRRRVVAGSASGGVCTANWARDLTNGVIGYDGGASVPTAISSCITGTNYQQNTDIILVRYAGPDVVPPGAGVTSSQWYIRTAVADGGPFSWMYQGTAPASAVSNTAEEQVFTMVYNAELFWVRRCSDPGADNTCGTGDDGDGTTPIPTLMRSYLDSAGQWVSEPLAEGMEQLQIEYQTMNGPWINATAVTNLGTAGNPWDRVTGARIAGVMRSAQRDAALPPDANTYALSTDTPAYVPPVPVRSFMRMAYQANAVIRARVRPAPII